MYGHTKSTEALLDKGADIDALNGRLRETPLIIAAIYAPKVGEILVRRGARVDLCDWHGTTALKRAKEDRLSRGASSDADRKRLVELLEEAEARVRAESSGPKLESDVLRERGNEAFKKGNFRRAIELYTESLSFLEDYRTFSNRAACKLRLAIAEETRRGHLSKESYEIYTSVTFDAGKAATLKPDFAKGWYRLARGQMGIGDLPRAKWSLKDGLKKCPDDPDLKKLLDELNALGVGDSISGTFAGRAEKAQRMVERGAQVDLCAWCQAELPLPMRQWEKRCPYCAGDPEDEVDRLRLDALRLS